ncbi:MAG: hypothetical protein FIA92_00580 [Chloroflexi bacterium]|nr:hypothetical protein [Chloroflexota bacterium]
MPSHVTAVEQPTDAATAPQPTAIILGAHIAALGTLRRLTDQGVPCQVLDDTTDIITHSRWYRPTARRLAETDDSAALAEHLEGLPVERAVVIPCSDTWTLAVSGLPELTRERFMASVPPRSTVEQLVDKRRFRELVDRVGLPHPRTAVIREPADLDQVSDLELTDGFLKPIDSQLHNRHYGTKGHFVHSRGEAERMVRDAAARGITFLFQEWIPGGPARTILLDGFVDAGGSMRGILARRRVRMHPPRIANTTHDVTIPLAEVEPAVEHTRRLFGSIPYRGVFNIEFKEDPRDGEFRVIELNPRPFWLIAHTAAAGLDLPQMVYRDAQGLPVPEVTAYAVGRHGIYELPEIRALVSAWSALRRPDGPVIGPWLRGDHILLSRRDPMPAVAAVWNAASRRAATAVGRGRPAPGGTVGERAT